MEEKKGALAAKRRSGRPFLYVTRIAMTRQKRKASGLDETHDFWPKAMELWQRGYSNAQVAKQAQAQGHDLNEDQVRYARNHHWTAAALPARGAKWLRAAVREATEVYPNALEQQQALFENNFEVFQAIKERLLARLASGAPTNNVELVELKVLVDAYVRQGRLLNETNETITVLHAKLGRLESSGDDVSSPGAEEDGQLEVEQWAD